jgi:protocatechuate 3,4-dioxygenase, beta subunit
MSEPASYKHDEDNGQPPYLYPAYRSTVARAPRQPLVPLPHTLSEITGPIYGHNKVGPTDNDLTRHHDGQPLGERIIVLGRVMDVDGRPLPDTLLEIWQANSAGRYRHDGDNHPAPLDPNFSGGGRCATEADGSYRFVTIKPGAYPWGNGPNAWRPAHIHFSLFGPAFATRLVTQMYFPGDPLLEHDPIANSIPDPQARQRLLARLDMAHTEPEWALAYEFNIVLRGRDATPMES